MSTEKYKIIIEPFAEKHFLKKIRKKYKKSFDIPWRAFELMLQKFDLMLQRSDTHQIATIEQGVTICKTGFKIMPRESVKSSGNRCIVVQDTIKMEIRIVLVYHKSDVRGSKETQWWKQMIKENYPEYMDYL